MINCVRQGLYNSAAFLLLFNRLNVNSSTWTSATLKAKLSDLRSEFRRNVGCTIWIWGWPHHSLLKACWITMASVPVYCLCRLPYDVTRFMIECDICQDWFHGRYGFFLNYKFIIQQNINCGCNCNIYAGSCKSLQSSTYDNWVFLCSCVGVEEDKAAEIDLYHCPNCEVTHGPSVSEWTFFMYPCHSIIGLYLFPSTFF